MTRRALVASALLVATTLFVSSTPTAFAQESDTTEVQRAAERLERALEGEDALSQETKDALLDLIGTLKDAPQEPPPPRKGEIARVVDEYLSTQTSRAEPAAYARAFEKLKFYGDFRFRHESSFVDDKEDRHRERIRVRFGLNYQFSDEVLFGARAVTGDRKDPASTHITLGDGFDSLEVSLDRAFITYQPTWLSGSSGSLGKFSHPFYQNPVYGELLWDADVQPEGALARYSAGDVGPLDSVNVAAGAYTILESSITNDVYMLVGQASGRLPIDDQIDVRAAVGYYWYTDPTPDGSAGLTTINAGNAVVDTDGDGTPDEYRSNFGILNPILALDYGRFGLPLTASAEYILNTRADGDDDEGWAVGASLGSSQNKGDWRLYYQWQVIEQDSVFAAFAQDDFLRRTNHRSHLVGVNHQITDAIGLHLWSLVTAPERTPAGVSDDDDWRLRLDLNIKF